MIASLIILVGLDETSHIEAWIIVTGNPLEDAKAKIQGSTDTWFVHQTVHPEFASFCDDPDRFRIRRRPGIRSGGECRQSTVRDLRLELTNTPFVRDDGLQIPGPY